MKNGTGPGLLSIVAARERAEGTHCVASIWPRARTYSGAECAAGPDLADCSLQGPNRDQVPIVYVAHIIRAQRNESLSSAGGCDELDLEMVRVMDLDNCA